MDSINPQSKHKKHKNPNSLNTDRLSNLPDPLIHHILSYLDTKQVAQTIILSKFWKPYITSVTFLNFDRNLGNYVTDASFKDTLRNVMYTRGYSGSVTQKLRIDFGEFWDFLCILGNVRIGVVAGNLQELCLLFTRKEFDMLELGDSGVFECESLKVLEIGFRVYWPSHVLDLPEFICLPKLKRMKLCSIIFLEDIGSLFSSCPVLETLELYFCGFAEDTDLVISAMKLKRLVIEDFVVSGHLSKTRIRIHAPSLTSFRCKDFTVNDYRLGKFSSLVNADIDMAIDGAIDIEGFGIYLEKKGKHGQRVLGTFKKLCAVQTLTLSSWSLQFLSDVLDELLNQATLFHNLRTLNVKTFCSCACYRSLTCLLKSLPSVETLVMYSEKDICSCLQDGVDSLMTQLSRKQHNDEWEKELSSQCMFHRLKFVEIRNFKGCKVEAEFLEFLLKNAMALEKLVVTKYKTCSSSKGKDLEEFKSFPCASSSVVMSFPCDRRREEDVIQDIQSLKDSCRQN